MINFSLSMTPASTLDLDALRRKALPAVIDELAACGYTVDHDDIAADVDQNGLRYRLQPGPATLTTVTKAGVPGSIEFLLKGNRFGFARTPGEKDQLLWMGLVHLGRRFRDAYKVVANVSDPDFATGERGSPDKLPT